MTRFRLYGQSPYPVALLHGGPGAAGSLEPVAQRLGIRRGVVEQIQNELTIDRLIDELKTTIELHCSTPTVLIGHSWGAWLGYLFTARHCSLVKKLIMISAGPFIDSFVPQISINRLNRLDDNEKQEYLHILEVLNDQKAAADSTLVERLGSLAGKADTYESLTEVPIVTPARCLINDPVTMYSHIWPEAAHLRKSGELLRQGSLITCPVVAIHGKNDSHPAAGVHNPLSSVIKNFRMISLDRCGHTPWNEKWATEQFYTLLEEEIDSSDRR